MEDREWTLIGPAQARLTFDETAKHFGYEPKTLRHLVRQGLFPAPRGVGQQTYYTGDDVAAITLLLGRWRPQELPDDDAAQPGTKPPESARNRPKVPRTAQDSDSET